MKKQKDSNPPVRCSVLLDDICARLQNCNERKQALMALPPIKHDMILTLHERLDAFERLQSERVAEDISIMSEALAVMKDMDALMSSNSGDQRSGG
jgi:hypothetical protein